MNSNGESYLNVGALRIDFRSKLDSSGKLEQSYCQRLSAATALDFSPNRWLTAPLKDSDGIKYQTLCLLTKQLLLRVLRAVTDAK